MKKEKLRILFRISGGNAPSTELGFGHIYRAINLASQLKFCKIFFLVEDYGHAKRVLINHGFKNIIQLEKNVSVKKDTKSTKNEIEKKDIDILIVDKYGPKLNNNYLQKLRKIVKVVLVTDLEKKQFPVDLLVSGFIGHENKIAKNKYGAKCLFGPKYQILNKKFSNKNLGLKKEYILATFGGFDENNIAQFFLNECKNISTKMKVKIIQGPIKKIKKRNKIAKNIELISETKNMFKEMSHAKFGFSSGGLTSYEFAAMEIPFAIICQVKHQLQTAKQWEKRGIAKNLGLFNKLNRKKLRKLLDEIMNEKIMKPRIKKIVDGKGSERVAFEILKLR